MTTRLPPSLQRPRGLVWLLVLFIGMAVLLIGPTVMRLATGLIVLAKTSSMLFLLAIVAYIAFKVYMSKKV